MGGGERSDDVRAQGEAGGGAVIVVHALDHAVAALEAARQAGRPVRLLSAPGAGVQAGPGWFAALVAEARAAVPDAAFAALLDCGDDAGAAQAAIRAGIAAIVFTGRTDLARRLADIAARAGASLVTERPAAALDLGDQFFAPPEVLRRCCAAALRAPEPAGRPMILASRTPFC